MMQRMREYALMRKSNRLNEWNEQIAEWHEIGTIRAAVSLASGSTKELNQILRIESTHTAVTYDNTVQTGDRFGGYEVLFVNTGKRMNVLNLKRTDALETAVEG